MHWISDVRTDPEGIRRYMAAWAKFYFAKKLTDTSQWDDNEWRRRMPESHPELHDHLYNNLSILDGKARVLMSSTSIFTALMGILLTDREIHNNKSLVLALSVSGALSLVSVFMVLLVILVHWSTTEELERRDLETAIFSLVLTRNKRTCWYRLAWVLHIIILIAMSCIFLFYLLGIYGVEIRITQ